MNSRATNESQVLVPITLLLFRPSAIPFASLSSLFVLSPTFRHRDESVAVGLIGARSSMKPCCLQASVARGEELLVCVQ